jgi:hypothetical protein
VSLVLGMDLKEKCLFLSFDRLLSISVQEIGKSIIEDGRPHVDPTDLIVNLQQQTKKPRVRRMYNTC